MIKLNKEKFTSRLEVKIVGLVFVVLITVSLAIGYLSSRFIKTDVHRIVDIYSTISINFIRDAVLETMVTGNSEVTQGLVKKHTKTSHIESLIILNPQGRESFSDGQRSHPEDLTALQEIRKTKTQKVRRTGSNIIYYTPLMKTSRCVECHLSGDDLLGVMKVSVSIQSIQEQILLRTKIIVISLIAGTVLFGFIFWLIFRMTVISPIRKIESATNRLSGGDLTFRVDIETSDEMGRLSRNLGKAVREIGKVIHRVGDVARRVTGTTRDIELESKKVVDGTVLESNAVNTVVQSVEKFNESITTVNMAIEDFSVSVIDGIQASRDMLVDTENIRGNTDELSEAVNTTASSIDEMSANMKDVAQRTEELSLSTEEAVSAIGQINLSIKEIESSTKESSRLSEKIVSDASVFGMDAVRKTAESMETIKKTVEKTADFIERLHERSDDIGKILNVIDDITDQTSLLSFNAAILAAQSGEHGKGFAVVAEEIKGLAERTSLSTQEISTLIQTVQEEVNSASQAMSEGIRTIEEGSNLSSGIRDAFTNIMESLKSSNELTLAVERATTEQTDSIGFVGKTIEKVRNMVAHIARATAEYSDGISQIVLATEKISSVTQTVRYATIAQVKEGKNLTKSLESFSERVQEISHALKQASKSSEDILSTMEEISSIPEQNRKMAFSVNRSIRSLVEDADVLMNDLNSFTIAKITDDSSVIKMGVIPLESPADMYRRFIPLAQYLTGKLGKQVEIRSQINYDETIKDLGEGRTDLCYMTPSTYISSHEQFGVEVLLKALRHGQPHQRIVIITRRRGKVSALSEMKGKSFAFGDILSTSSYIVPRAMLLDEGITLDDLSFYDFLGHHDDVVKAVLKGDFDAGGVMESAAEKIKDENLLILKHSLKVPEFNICVRRDITSQLRNDIKQAILDLSIDRAEDKKILQSISPAYTGFIEARHEDYLEIRGLMVKLGIL